MKNSFEKSMEIYNKIAKNNFENSVIEFNSPKPTIRAIDPILQRPENAVESTMEKMIENTGNHIDYTTTSFYILEKLFKKPNRNESWLQLVRKTYLTCFIW